MILKVVLLIMLTSLVPVSAMDNCPKANNYLCGDVCVWEGGVCDCNDTQLKRANVSSVQCCATDCTAEETSAAGVNIRVQCTTNATVSSLSVGCPAETGNKLCNYHPGDGNRNYVAGGIYSFFRSYWPCSSGEKCVAEHTLCHGESRCSDMSDINRYCERENTSCSPPNWRRCGDSGQCVPDTYWGNKNYNCLNREDELVDTETTNTSSAKLETCSDAWLSSR